MWLILGLISIFISNSFAESLPPPMEAESVAPRAAPALARVSKHSLSNHLFLRNTLINTPFTCPYIRSTLEGAMATFRIAGAESDISAAGLSPTFIGQFGLSEQVGLEISAGITEVVGSDAYSALVLGANFSYGLTGTLKLALVKNSTAILTPFASYGFQNGSNFSPVNAVALGITTLAQANANNFLSPYNTSTVRVGLFWGLAFNPSVGLTGELSRSFIYSTAGTSASVSDDSDYRAGIVLNANLLHGMKIPIGFTAGFRYDSPISTSSEPSPIIQLGIFEMTKSNFNFGVEITRLMIATPTLSGILSLTYYY